MTVQEPDPTYDLDAVIAEREPRSPFTFRFGGEVYSLPAWPDLRAAAALDTGRIYDGLRLLLGAEQWARLQAAEAVFDEDAFVDMYRAYQRHIGAALGESGASST